MSQFSRSGTVFRRHLCSNFKCFVSLHASCVLRSWMRIEHLIDRLQHSSRSSRKWYQPSMLDWVPVTYRRIKNIDPVKFEAKLCRSSLFLSQANCAAMLYTGWDISISCFWAAILDFWLPFKQYNIKVSFIKLLDLLNMDTAFWIMQHSCMQSELTCISDRHLGLLYDNLGVIIVRLCSPVIITIIWFGDTHRVALYKMWYKLKSACSVVSMLNQTDVFLSALQKYLNQKRKTSNQQAKHSNFQLLGPATAKDLKPHRWLGTTMSPWAADLKADRPDTKEVLVK